MSDSPDHTALVYPAPTIVVGLGRFGLSVVERLAEDWQSLRQATDDASLENLRLVQLRPDDDGSAPGWRAQERQFVAVARYTGDGDLPTLAIDFVILRALGLIRYANGAYQVALPRDAGVVEIAYADDEATGHSAFARRRYFEWLTLSPDPLNAVERLRLVLEREPDLEVFVAPLLNRVRRGHSPRVVLACISRCRALSEGRDPTPWRWFTDALADADPDDAPLRSLGIDDSWLTDHDRAGLLDGFAPEPLTGWSTARVDATRTHARSVRVPGTFVPRAGDLPTPVDPTRLLRVDWQRTGWATEQVDPETVEFTPVDASAFRLGLFDHDQSPGGDGRTGEQLSRRLAELGAQAHRGMVRMWVDLQRERVEDAQGEGLDDRRREGVDDALRQTLEILGELLVRPLITERGADDASAGQPAPPLAGRDDRWVDGDPLPLEPSATIRQLCLGQEDGDNPVHRALHDRLAALGFTPPADSPARRKLFEQLTLQPEDVQPNPQAGATVDPDRSSSQRAGLLELRRTLNDLTRQLFDFGFLSTYRTRPVRRPPRLTIYVVGDTAEPFVRSAIRPVLREIHAELLRAYGPIFESYREGFDRALSVVPILWMPHPSDAFGGNHPMANRCEEAAIIESIQGVRRWIEAIPRGTRCIPQMFVNSRVTDNAVLGVRQAARQTRDFLTFQMRNDLGAEPWLRRTATGTHGDDVFSSFSCHEIDFPAERAREYLANRLARDCIRQTRQGVESADAPDVSSVDLAAPDHEALVAEPLAALTERAQREADRLAGRAEGLVVDDDLDALEVHRRFDDDFETHTLEAIGQTWRELTADRGTMDALVDALRQQTSRQLGDTLARVRDEGDQLIAEHASDGGLGVALAGFRALESVANPQLRDQEARRRDYELKSLRHRVPQTAGIGQAREQVLDAAEAKPSGASMRMGLVLWALMAPAMGGPLAWTLAYLLELDLRPNLLEVFLGPLGVITGALVVFLPVFFLLRRHMRRHVDALADAVADLADAIRRVVAGGKPGLLSQPSIRSFMEARLRHTTALATRNYATQIYRRVLRDVRLADRLRQSIDVQQSRLLRHAEDLGVRTTMTDTGLGEGDDDVSQLFASHAGLSLDRLIEPETLVNYYGQTIGGQVGVQSILGDFLSEAGGFDRWRREACLSDTERILRLTRRRFDEIVAEPVSNQFVFQDEVSEHLLDFVARHYPNIGFAARFTGYEGLDPDGLDILARTSLVVHPDLRLVFEEARASQSAGRKTQTLDVIEAPIVPNTAYMLSLVQGIRPHSLRNLRRFESFHDRAHMPDDRTFPMTGERDDHQSAPPLNHLSGYGSLRASLGRVVHGSATDDAGDGEGDER